MGRATGLRVGKPADPSVTSPPLRRSPCSSIRKGVPLYGWNNRGEPPRRWLLSEPRLVSLGPRRGAAHAQAGPPTTCLPQGNGPHPGDIRPGSQDPWGRVRGNGSLPCHPEDRAFSRGPHYPAALPPPHRQSARGRPADVGPGRGACQGSTPGGAGLGGQDHRPRTRSSVVSQAWAQPWRLRVLVWLKQPTLPRGGNLGPGGFHSNVCATYARRDCDPCNLGLPELQPPYL